jgi:type IV fimbrial biogenesis protein FimT
MHHRHCGYSLYELLLTTTIITLMLLAGFPTFSALTARQLQSIEVNALFHAIHLARKESIMRRRVVSLCPSHDGQNCGPRTDWSSGWIMFENKDRDTPPRVDEGEPVLQWHRVAGQVNVQANRRAFTLRSTVLRATNGTLVVCDRQNRVPAKGLVISYTGRPRVAFRRTDGKPYACAD